MAETGSPLLHRFVGPHGVLWAVVLAGFALWWSAAEAWTTVRDASPSLVDPAFVLQDQVPRRRWVQVRGISLSLEPALFGQQGGPDTPTRVLVDPRDSSATFWRELARLVEGFSPGDVDRGVDGPAGERRQRIQDELQDRLARIQSAVAGGAAERRGVIPQAGLLVDDPWRPTGGADATADGSGAPIAGGTTGAAAGASNPGGEGQPSTDGDAGVGPDDGGQPDGGDPEDDGLSELERQMLAYRQSLRRFVQAARQGISTDVEVTGRLARIEESATPERARALGIATGELMLRADARPRRFSLYVAAGAIGVLSLLAAAALLPGGPAAAGTAPKTTTDAAPAPAPAPAAEAEGDGGGGVGAPSEETARGS